MLTLLGVSKAFGHGPLVFEPVTATLPAAACVAVRGPHGAGKSILLRIIAGLDPPTVGGVRLDGKPAPNPGPLPGAALILPEHPLLESRTILENLVLSQRLANQPRRIAVDAAYAMLQRLDLVALADRLPAALSRSQHRLACIARAVLRRARVVVADEPGAGLRPDAAALARALLAEAVVQGACLVLAATADDPATPEPTQVVQLRRPESDRQR